MTRAGFVDRRPREWSSHVDPYMYDLEAPLRPIAMQVPAWQLYGASLVGDFRTMSRILTGVEGAGAYINALAAPQPKTAYAPLLSTGVALRRHGKHRQCPQLRVGHVGDRQRPDAHRLRCLC